MELSPANQTLVIESPVVTLRYTSGAYDAPLEYGQGKGWDSRGKRLVRGR